MTQDEFIDWDTDDGAVTLGSLQDGEFIIVKRKGEHDGAITTPEQLNAFEVGFAHAYSDGKIMRYLAVIGNIDDIAAASAEQSNIDKTS